MLQLPDSAPVLITAILTPRQYDSLTAAERKAARPDSTRADTVTRRDSAAAGAPRAAGALRGGAAARGDTAAARRDTAEVRRLLAQRPVPFDKVVLRFARPLTPETRYLIRVHGVVNLTGAAADGQIVVLTPKRVAPSDSARAKPPPPR